MTTLFWIMIGMIFYTYVGYPLLMAVLALFVRRPVKRNDTEPNVTMIVAAYNEEKYIKEKLDNILSLDYPRDRLEVITVSDGSTDQTDEIVQGYGDESIRLYRVEGRVGKTEARNRAVETAKGEIIVFSDATTIYDRSAIRKLVRNFSDPQVGAVSGRYDYVHSHDSTIARANILFWRYENFIKKHQSAIKTLTGMSGCINSFRTKLYTALPPDIIEDLVEPLTIIEKGYRIVFEPDAEAYELPTKSSGDEFKMRIRVISQGMRGLWFARKLLNPFRYGLVSFQLFCHKGLRWLMPFFLLGLFVVNALLIGANWLYQVAFILQLVFYLTAGLGLLLQKSKKRLGPLSFPLYFCTLNLASLMAFFRAMKGQTVAKWETMR